jgi:hypothetical protein
MNDPRFTQPLWLAILRIILPIRLDKPRHLTEIGTVGTPLTYLGEAFLVRKGWLRRRLEPTGQVACPACGEPSGIATDIDWGVDFITGRTTNGEVFRTTCCDSIIKPIAGLGWVIVKRQTETT